NTVPSLDSLPCLSRGLLQTDCAFKPYRTGAPVSKRVLLGPWLKVKPRSRRACDRTRGEVAAAPPQEKVPTPTARRRRPGLLVARRIPDSPEPLDLLPAVRCTQ